MKLSCLPQESPDRRIYFEVVRDPQTCEPSAGKRVTYPETEQLAEFFAGEVDSSGRTCRAILFGKGNCLFRNLRLLAHWPSTDANHSERRIIQWTHYNEKGPPSCCSSL